MSIKIDLRIFLFGILFFWTKQVEIYATIMFFAFLHEIAHLCTGLALRFRPKTMQITPVGFQIAFETKIEYYNKKIEKGNELHIKKIILYLAGPITNFLFILICFLWKTELVIPKEIIIYSNLLLAIFNLLPIYPLDGGRVLKEVIHIFKGTKIAYQKSNFISFVTVIILTIIVSISILYIHNIAFLLILIYLWYLVIKNQKEYEIYEKTMELTNSINNM
jgi:stage IV sporulation protein FB